MIFSTLAEAYSASTARPVDTLTRLQFWIELLGSLDAVQITPDQVDDGLAKLTARGKLRPVRNGAPVPTGKPMAPATITRYANDLAGCFRYGRKQRILPRGWTPPTKGLEVAQSPLKDAYISMDDKDRLVKVARALDRRWGRMTALVEVAFSSGWRAGSLKGLKWQDIDLDAGIITAPTSKTGKPLVTPISTAAAAELRKLTHRWPQELVFSNKQGKPYEWRKLWLRVTESAGMSGRNFHLLRHGCATTLVSGGASQAQIMLHMGHASLVSSRRYMHNDIAAKRELSQRVFG